MPGKLHACRSCGRLGWWSKPRCQKCIGPIKRLRTRGEMHDGVADPKRLDALGERAAQNLALFPQRRCDR